MEIGAKGAGGGDGLIVWGGDKSGSDVAVGCLAGMAMCVKRMLSRSCLGHFSRFGIPTLMYILLWDLFNRWEIISPKFVKPISSPGCLSNTRLSLMCISSSSNS